MPQSEIGLKWELSGGRRLCCRRLHHSEELRADDRLPGISRLFHPCYILTGIKLPESDLLLLAMKAIANNRSDDGNKCTVQQRLEFQESSTPTRSSITSQAIHHRLFSE